MLTSKKAYEAPIAAQPIEGEVVLVGPGVCAAFQPEAVLASLEDMRRAAEEAIRQRESGPVDQG